MENYLKRMIEIEAGTDENNKKKIK